MATAALQVIAEIEAAFDKVVLGDGVGLREGQGLDNYYPREALTKVREGDEKFDWRKISAEELRHCASSLSFFDAEGMRFHLPAFMIHDLRGSSTLGPLYSLLHGFTADDCHVMTGASATWRAKGEPDQTWFQYASARFHALNEAQAAAVVSYLRLKATEDDFERPRIEQALANYWERRASPSAQR